MKLLDYISSGCDNFHSEFTLTDVTKTTGVITTFFSDEPTEYYLVRTNDLILMYQYQNEDNKLEMRKFVHKINFEIISTAKRIN